ncbi:MAG: ABC transporter permease [Rhodobacterales bacterium]|nr:MAG: ABC transporter permease [Rhodobacterales bacterium]
MFEYKTNQSTLSSGLRLAELVYHATVRSVRQSHGNAFMALFMNILQTVVFVMAFYVMFSILGLKSLAVRGDFLIYIMSGIFLFLTHIKALGAVVGSEGPASPMMKHAPMNTLVAISAAALGSLYIQILSLFVVLFVYHVAFTPVYILDPVRAMGMLLVAWFTGVAIGMVFLAAKPWFPAFVGVASSVYSRANMIASGKMFLANNLPPERRNLFDWNPLFHSIDQARGFTFLNYNPHYTSISYPLILGVVLIMIGLMGEFYTRKHASASWSARR